MKSIKISLLLSASLLFANQQSILAQVQKSNAPVYVNDAERNTRVQANLKIIQESNDLALQQRAMQLYNPLAKRNRWMSLCPF